MEKAFGRVVKVNGDIAEVLIERGSMCGENCSSCGMCDKNRSKILAKNTVGAKIGDKVVLRAAENGGLKAAVLVYAVPVLILIATIVLLLQAGVSESAAIIAAFFVMALWFLSVFAADKRGAFNAKICVQITEICYEK